MTRVDMAAVTAIIREAAAEHILPYFRNLGSGDIAFKIGDDPVTIADKRTESALSERLLDLLPGSKVVGEEAFAANNGILDQFFGESPVWIIDPIDGTRNFVKGSPCFGVIVALSKQNQPVAGWIYDPTSDEVICAEKGAGAFYKGRKLGVLPPAGLPDMHGFLGDRLLAAYDKGNPNKALQPDFEVMAAGAHEYPRLVLSGAHFGKDTRQSHFRASFMYSYPWDDAAGVLIHSEAGGYSAFWDGEPYRPSTISTGLALAPDKDSWHALKNWCMTFADLPKDKAA